MMGKNKKRKPSSAPLAVPDWQLVGARLNQIEQMLSKLERGDAQLAGLKVYVDTTPITHALKNELTKIDKRLRQIEER